MKGDFTRTTFEPKRHYSSVRMQQGRVQLDADWNEQLDIAAHRVETEALDVIGRCGAPLHNAGLQIAAAVADLPVGQQTAAGKLTFRAGDLYISAGRFYVDGILCENEQPVLATGQPDLPADPEIVLDGNKWVKLVPPPPEGVYLVYLDVWQRHVTAIEAPHVLETALGGPDTCTRTKTVWQVRLCEGSVCPDDAILTERAAWWQVTEKPTGKLSARAEPGAVATDPCIVAPGAGYRRLENQLYRVEVHKSGTLGTAKFKWSRDNGSILTTWEGKSGNDLTVGSTGRDQPLGFAAGQWIELSDDERDQRGEAGTLVQLVKVEGQVLAINPGTATGSVDIASFKTNPKIRRWDSAGPVNIELPGGNQGFIPLEGGVEVKFSQGTYRAGDYWLIPARTATGDVEWPKDPANNSAPIPQPPHGIEHHYCSLAVAEFKNGQWTIKSDCRELFPPVTELTQLYYVSGDGQDALPGQQLPRPLQVGVANGSWPVAGAKVHFRIGAGSGQLQGGGQTGAEVEVSAGPDGVAECNWRLDNQTPSQWVEATLVAGAALPVRFNASLRDVGGPEPGIHIDKVLVGRSPLRNDTEIRSDALANGIEVICDQKLFPGSVKGKPTCFVTLDMPFPFNNVDQDLWGRPVIGFQPLILAAETGTQDERIIWQPTGETAQWLRDRLFQRMTELARGNRVLAHLTLKGNFIWAAENPNLFLDGNAFGLQQPSATNTDIDLPSGDDRRGGDFEMWFWLVTTPPPPPPPPPLLESVSVNPSRLEDGSGETVSGQVFLSRPAPAGGVVVTLRSTNMAVAGVPGSVQIEAGQTESQEFTVTPRRVGQARITATLEGVSRTAIFTMVRGPII
jgi:hypothetical protein